VSSDCYAILGVTPAAEDVVIRAAYRALMRHYHPDTNPDPEAQEKAREITVAYSVLRDPAKRAQHDARLAAGDHAWFADEPDGPPPPPPAMRGVGIGAAVLALALVGVVWAWPQTDAPVQHRTAPASKPTVHEPAATPVQPVVQLEPESERLANLRRDSEILATPPAGPPPVAIPDVPQPDPPKPVRVASAEPIHALPAPRRARPTPITLPPPVKAASDTSKAAPLQTRAGCPSGGCKSDKIATLERMSAGFFSQSMVHADRAKKDLLVSARDRFAAERKACRSESCVSDSYVRQIRETSAIVERAASPRK